MKILIIGHKGNLGQQLMKVFEDFSPIGWDKEDVDITDENSLDLKITKLKPQIIINASAYNAVDKCEEDQKEFKLAQEINGYGPGYLAKTCQKIEAVLVHYSTDYVFDGEKKEGYQENDLGNPVQNYGKSKYLGEQEIQNKTDQYFIIRTSKLFGPPGKSEVTKKSFIDIMLDLAKEKDVIEVVNEEVSCFTYTPDLAKATKKILGLEATAKKDAKPLPFGIYHIVNEAPCTWFECATKLFEIAGKTVETKAVPATKFPRPAQRPAYSILLNTKFPKLRSWEKAVEEYLALKNK
ncbi:MAG: dTDP-4-dehydrorhamnose reductase [Patescibacteria group bacterium]|nr:dTDP-4-dehydrorhamnose reductase [Patescibacteria group bacterium]